MAYRFGTRGNDTLIGTNDDDHFFAGDGDDTARGGFGNDTFHASQGSDTFIGEQGIDTVDYSNVVRASNGSFGVAVILEDGIGLDGGTTDYLSSIENVTGSNYNDMIGGDNNVNVILGLDGNDIIAGGGGGDTLDGGDGIDTLGYAQSNAGVRIDLLNNSASGGEATGDRISNFENVVGSQFTDYLYGTNGDNTLNGQDGADRLYGRGGNDTLIGWDGNDRLDGGANNDTLDGGYDDDILTGGSGRDTFVFNTNMFGDGQQDDGHDTITDFQVGQDRIFIDNAVESNMHATARYTGDSFYYDLTIQYSPTESITVEHIAVNQISAVLDSIDYGLS